VCPCRPCTGGSPQPGGSVDQVSRNRNKPRSPQRRQTRPADPVPTEEALADLELVAGLDEAIASPHPLALFGYASSMVAAVEPDPLDGIIGSRRINLDDGTGVEVDIRSLVDSFLDVGLRQTDALLLVLKELLGDDLLRERIRREVAARRNPVPGWLLRLDQVHPSQVVVIGDVLGDWVNILVGVDLPGRKQLTMVVYINHTLGTLVKDAFALPTPLDQVLAWYQERGAAGWTRPMSLADARAHIEQAVQTGRITFPPLETDTWPAARPLLEWFLRLLPEGGTSFIRPEWDQTSLNNLADEFFASPHATTPDRERLDGTEGSDPREILHTLLGYGVNYDTGDPLRWSPTNVELVLLDWIPRKIIANPDYLAQFPNVLRALVRYAHTRRGIPHPLTTDTLHIIDACEPEYLQLIRKTRRRGTKAMLELLGIPKRGIHSVS
jgi:hypothetical protein